MLQSILIELEEVRKSLSKNHPRLKFTSSTENIAKLLKITPDKAIKFIDILEQEEIDKDKLRLLKKHL